MQQAGGPLSHVRVLDLSRILAAPWASQTLADLGADVIKVERPGTGDDTRSWGPPFLKDGDGNDTQDAGYYLAANRGKRSIAINLDRPEGRRIVLELAKRSDILLENYKFGTLQRFGLDYTTLRDIHPGLIYCSVTGFGQTGPRREQPAYDFLIQAMGGLMSVTGERDDRPGGGPQKVGIPIVDLMTGMYATVSVLAALARRGETGQGEYIDISMFDVQIAILANQAMNHLISGNVPQRNGNAHPNIQPQDVYRCRDGDLIVVIGNDGQFARFCAALGRSELAHDARFTTNAARVRNITELSAILAREFGQRRRADVLTALDAAGVPSGAINNIAEVFQEPQTLARGMLRHVPHPLGGQTPQIASPIRFSETPLPEREAPPSLGQHSASILRELGYEDEAIDSMLAGGVIG